ncbi:MAG: exlusion protein FxsA [Gammaproteobacteria bacterium HGW-Gammaproteobacteria-3]|nr:MAG: exlusion protein FxsA [Gammaproteobacteria bacterium HGW-Gammaproteobacteria-3]
MRVFRGIFLLFLIIPFVEIYLLLTIGGIIGALPTVFLVVFTAALGAWLLRRQGFATWQRFQASLAQGAVPAYEMIEGPLLLIGGALLLTPGFFTDALGFACLVPSLRRRVARYIIEKHLLQAGGPFQPTRTPEKDVLEGEYRKED